MNSRVMRMLLKLYPRRIRNRYGNELLDLYSELQEQGDLSHTRLIRDMMVGALLVRPGRQRAHLVIGAVLVIVGLATAGTIIGSHGTDAPARASHLQAQLTVRNINVSPSPYGSCFVAAGSSCSLTPCTEFIAQSSTQSAVAHSSIPTIAPQPRLTPTRCNANPHVGPSRAVFRGRTVKPARPKR